MTPEMKIIALQNYMLEKEVKELKALLKQAYDAAHGKLKNKIFEKIKEGN